MIKINLENINETEPSKFTFNKTSDTTGEFIINTKIININKKEIEKLDKAHRKLLQE